MATRKNEFTLRKEGPAIQMILAAIATATVIPAGKFVALDTGLIVEADASSAAIAWTPKGSVAGETEIEVTTGNDFTLKGTADADFAVTQKGTEVDLVVTDGNQLIDVGASTTDVLRVGIGINSGVIASALDIEVKINKPLF